MWRMGLLVLLVSGACRAQGADDFRPATTNVWGAEYPRVDSKGRVQIRFKAPEAAKVRLNFWNLIAARRAKPMIVVMAYGYARRAGKAAPDMSSKPFGSAD